MPARFEMCRCGRHGRVVQASGFRGCESSCKQHALHMVRSGAQLGIFDDDEQVRIIEEILKAKLPHSIDDADVLVTFNADAYNHSQTEGTLPENLTDQAICKLVTDKTNKHLIPRDFLWAAKQAMQSWQPS